MTAKWYECNATHKYTGKPLRARVFTDGIYAALLRFRDWSPRAVDISIKPVEDKS